MDYYRNGLHSRNRTPNNVKADFLNFCAEARVLDIFSKFFFVVLQVRIVNESASSKIVQPT